MSDKLRAAAQAVRDAKEILFLREMSVHDKVHPLLEDAINALRAALAEPKQEPVAFYVYKPTLPRGHLGNVSGGDLPWVYDQDPSSGYSARMLVYTAPPRREWVGLTDDEINAIEFPQSGTATMRDFVRIIEAKLREKNK